MRLTKQEFEVLWNIEYTGQTDIERIADGSPENVKQCMKYFLRLEDLGLIKIEIRESRIYGATLTEAGKKIVDAESYKKWIPE